MSSSKRVDGQGRTGGRTCLALDKAEAALTSARELLIVAEERLILAKERVRFAPHRKESVEEHLRIAQQVLANTRRLVAGAEQLMRIGEIYAAQAQRGTEELVLGDAQDLHQESEQILTRAYGHVGMLEYQLQGRDKEVEVEEKRLKYEAGVWFNANELLNLAEDQLSMAQARSKRALDRVSRSESRIRRLKADDPAARINGYPTS